MNPNVHFTTSQTSQGSSEQIQGLGKEGVGGGKAPFTQVSEKAWGKKRSIGKKLIKIPIKSIRNEHKIEGVLPILRDFGIFGFKGGFPSFGNKSEDSKSELAAGSE